MRRKIAFARGYAELLDSYSADALANLGITPGSTITKRGVTFTWPHSWASR